MTLLALVGVALAVAFVIAAVWAEPSEDEAMDGERVE